MHRRIPLLILPFLLALSTPAPAQVVWGLTAWHAGLGLASPDDIDNTFWLDGGLEVARMNENITLDARLMYWGSSVGLGDAEKVDRLTVRWPSGSTQAITNISANQVIRVVEDGETLLTRRDPEGP